MRLRLILPCSVSLALLLGACGSSGKAVSPATNNTTTAPGSQTTVHVALKASNVPSVSAKMICEDEAQKDIYEQATGVKTVAPFKPTWVDHVYACDYVYPGGAKMTLSVKETSNDAETTAYYDSLGTKLGRTTTNIGITNAYQVRDGSVVVRKDFKVLLVDVTKLPANFGVPADTRGHVAINVAQTIMGCWTGA